MTAGIDLNTAMRDFPHAEQWVFCPACGEEWTKLRECFWFEDKAKQTSSVCVECAESMKNFKWITEQWPIIKPFENWQDDWIEIYSFWPKDRPTHAYCSSYDPKTRQPIKEKVMFWKVLMTVIKCWSGKKSDQENSEIMKFMLRSDFVNGKISAHDLKRKDVEPIVYDNAIEAWVGMKHRIGEARVNHEKAKEIEKSTWGNGEKRHKRF